jgi:hypothetical protein
MADEGKWDSKGAKWDSKGPKWDSKGSWAGRGQWSDAGKCGGNSYSPPCGGPQDIFNNAAALGGLLVVSFIAPVSARSQNSCACGPSARSAVMQEVARTIDGS